MASPRGHQAQQSDPRTVDPQVLSQQHNPHQSKRFNAEEWHSWMQWDGTLDSLSPKSPSNSSSSPSLQGGGSISQGSSSPSEAELPILPLTPVYRIPTIETPTKLLQQDVRRPANKKRKTSQAEGQEVRTRQPKGQKISHNVIEKRYRTNLNDKIARLRDSVPILKTAFEASQKQTGGDGGGNSGSEGSGSEDKGTASSVKFNKATVLTKATEYIEQLERANARLSSENSTLRRRVKDANADTHAPQQLYFRADEANATGSNLCRQPSATRRAADTAESPESIAHVAGMIPVAAEFQKLRAEAAEQPSYAPSALTPRPLSPSPTAPGSESMPTTPVLSSTQKPELIDFDTVKGSIPLPEYLQKNRIPISQQQHYAPPLEPSRYFDVTGDTFVVDEDESQPWWPRNRASKLLLGSLAGLMIMEGLSANSETAKPSRPGTHHRRGMFLPDDFYTESRGFRAQIRQRIIDFAHSPRGKRALPVLFLAILILGIVFLAFLYWSRNDPKARRRANSVSSNPERDDVSDPMTGQPNMKLIRAEGALAAKFQLRQGDRKEPNTSVVKGRGLFTEAVARCQGAWLILTTGSAASPKRHEPTAPTYLAPRLELDGKPVG